MPTRFRDPRDQVDVRRTTDRRAFDERMQQSAAASRRRRAAEVELALHDPDRLWELASAAQDAACERARCTHIGEPEGGFPAADPADPRGPGHEIGLLDGLTDGIDPADDRDLF